MGLASYFPQPVTMNAGGQAFTILPLIASRLPGALRIAAPLTRSPAFATLATDCNAEQAQAAALDLMELDGDAVLQLTAYLLQTDPANLEQLPANEYAVLVAATCIISRHFFTLRAPSN
jgi:hypothetical protein